jgi:hypothetical protein
LCSAQVSDRAEDIEKISDLEFLILLWIFRRGHRPSPTDKEMKKKDISFINVRNLHRVLDQKDKQWLQRISYTY